MEEEIKDVKEEKELEEEKNDSGCLWRFVIIAYIVEKIIYFSFHPELITGFTIAMFFFCIIVLCVAPFVVKYICKWIKNLKKKD